MAKKNKVAVLAIGTEVTSGQIVNRNSAWLSEQMEELGFESLVHISVPDDHDLMIDGLKKCTEHAEFVFTTGGLGPTTDDFTRDVIAEFVGKKLLFDATSWEKIASKMRHMGRPLLESQKQQCYFPEGALVLNNSAGTANAFFMEMPNYKLTVLPGPPSEVAAIWDFQLGEVLARFADKKSQAVLNKWNCMGKPEAELAEIVERLVKGSRLKTGYRLNAPYVEIKLWCESNDLASQQTYIDQVEGALKEWTILKNKDDPWRDFAEHIQKFKLVSIQDHSTDGMLATTLMTLLRGLNPRPQTQVSVQTNFNGVNPVMHSTLPGEFSVQVTPWSPSGEFEVTLATSKKSLTLKRKSPYVHRLDNDRSRLAAAEITILECNQFLTRE